MEIKGVVGKEAILRPEEQGVHQATTKRDARKDVGVGILTVIL